MRRLIWMFIVIDIADGVDSDDNNDHDKDTNNDGNRMEMTDECDDDERMLDDNDDDRQ